MELWRSICVGQEEKKKTKKKKKKTRRRRRKSKASRRVFRSLSFHQLFLFLSFSLRGVIIHLLFLSDSFFPPRKKRVTIFIICDKSICN